MNKLIFLIKKILDYFGVKDLLKINSNILIELLLKNKGYLLVGCSLTRVDAFFVSNNENLDLLHQPFTSEKHYEDERIFLIKYFSSYHRKKFVSLQNK